MLLLHGADDRLCLAEGSRRFFAKLTVPASDLRVYPELRHEIFNEPEREAVFEDVLAWMRRPAAAGAGSGTGAARVVGADAPASETRHAG
jgi:alpha-beta hydrolase superfamily lysophospholipase